MHLDLVACRTSHRRTQAICCVKKDLYMNMKIKGKYLAFKREPFDDK